ncbi:hypothetical protein C8Q70DRAFT_891602, partial [Cubamyces menziesii]
LLVSTLGIGCSRVSALAIETPQSVVQCMPTTIQWSDGTGPYFLAIHPTSGFDIGNDLQFKNLSGDSMTWIANVTAGTQLVAILTDLGSATGANAQSQPFIVGQGPNNSCLDSSSGSSTTTSAVSTASSAQSSDNARAPPTNTSAHTATSVASPNTSRSHPSTTAVSPSSGVPNPSGSSDT